MQYPITLARRDYVDKICDITNKCGLPAFVIADILEKILSKVRQQEELEVKRDEALWHKTLLEKAPKDGAKNNVNEVDK